MSHDLTPFNDIVAATRARLESYVAAALDCDVAALRQPGLSIVPTERRHRPEWHGWVLPLYGVSPIGTGACVLSCAPELATPLQAALAKLATNVRPFDPPWIDAVRTVATGASRAEWSQRRIFVTDAQSFRPHHVDPSVRIERVEPGADPDSWLNRAFDGPCFVVRDSRRNIAAWAGLKCKSDDAWEIAVETQPPYRGRGLATVLAATATEHVLSLGRLVLWVVDEDNLPSQRLAERLGFLFYGEQVAASFFDRSLAPPPPPASP